MTSEEIRAPVFQPGLTALKTEHFDLVYDYKDVLSQGQENQRAFLVPKSETAEDVLVSQAFWRRNQLCGFNLDSGETVTAIRFTRPFDDLIHFLNSETGQDPGRYGSGVPSLSALNATVEIKDENCLL